MLVLSLQNTKVCRLFGVKIFLWLHPFSMHCGQKKLIFTVVNLESGNVKSSFYIIHQDISNIFKNELIISYLAKNVSNAARKYFRKKLIIKKCNFDSLCSKNNTELEKEHKYKCCRYLLIFYVLLFIFS